jgi:hypothetical protein
MAFVVKATGRTGTVCWLSPTNEAGFRTLGPREWADVFQAARDAHIAISKLPRAFEDCGLIFSVKSADRLAPQ